MTMTPKERRELADMTEMLRFVEQQAKQGQPIAKRILKRFVEKGGTDVRYRKTVKRRQR